MRVTIASCTPRERSARAPAPTTATASASRPQRMRRMDGSGLGRRERTVQRRTRRLAEVRDRARVRDVVREERQDARPLEDGVEPLAATLAVAGEQGRVRVAQEV